MCLPKIVVLVKYPDGLCWQGLAESVESITGEDKVRQIEAIFFDMDGVIFDTEKDGHRVAFNAAFKEFGYDIFWDVDRYHEKLQIAGGKERIRHDMGAAGHFEKREDLRRADIIVNCLGDSDGPSVKVLKGGSRLRRSGLVKVSQLVEYFAT